VVVVVVERKDMVKGKDTAAGRRRRKEQYDK